MTVATKEMLIGQELPSLRKEISIDRMRLYAAWGNRNIHTDWDVAAKAGLPAPLAPGMMLYDYVSEMLTNFFGQEWLKGGKLSVSFIHYVVPGEVITTKGTIREKMPEDNALRMNVEIWCENQRGERVAVGTASSLVPSVT